MIGQVEVTTDLISSLISTIGVGGVLVWYLYHTTSKTMPELTDKFLASQERIASEFSNSLRDEREYRHAEMDALKVWIRTEALCKYNKDNPR